MNVAEQSHVSSGEPSAESAAARRRPVWWRRLLALPREVPARRAFWIMVGITVISAILRAAALSFPPALTDEAFTFWRVSGTFGQMLDNLRDDAFVPLHYEVVWVLTKLLGPDLWALRLPAAIAGVVLPYAVFRLGRVVGGRRVGLAAAAVASTSEFLAYFARNAKMYMPAWTWMTLALGSLLFFARARKRTRSRRLAWLTFVLFGVAATSTHAVVCIPLSLSPLVALAWARRRRLTTSLLVFFATAIVMAAPVMYYTAINTWFVRAGGLSGRSETGPAERDNGLMWIESWQADRSPENLLLECLSAYVGGIEWPSDHDTLDDSLAESIRRATGIVMIGLLAACAVAVATTAVRGGRGIGVAHLIICVLLIAAPFYGFYLRSFRTLAAPWALGGIAWMVAAFSCVAVFIGGSRRRPLWRRLAVVGGWLLILIATLTITWAGARFAYARAPMEENGLPRWNPLWMPRYSGFAAPLLCVLIGGIIATTPTLILRWTVLSAVIGLNLWLSIMSLRLDTEVPWPQIVHDVVAASRGNTSAVAMDWVHFPRQPFMSILPAPYYALVREEGIDVDQPDFRAGQTWPYHPGPVVQRLLKTLRYQPAMLLRLMPSNRRLDTIMLWRTQQESASESEPLPGWHIIEEKTYVVRFVWNWGKIYTYERLVLKKN